MVECQNDLMNAEAMSVEGRNAHYGNLNLRFDERTKELHSLGFKYQHVPGLGIAVFVKTIHGRTKAFAAGSVINADPIVWRDMLEEASRF